MHAQRKTHRYIYKVPCSAMVFGKILIVSSEWLEKSGIRRHCMLTGESECIQFVGCCSRTIIYQEFFLHLWGWFQLERLAT